MRPRSVLIAVGSLATLTALFGLWWWQARAITVALVRPTLGPAIEFVYATGYVEPAQPVTVASRLTAPVARVLVDEGEPVRRGQALLLLDDADLRETQIETEARSLGATLTERRSTTLYGQGWVTRAALDSAQAEARAARAAALAARARLDQTVIRAGIDGIVTKRDIEPGELALPGRTLLMLGDPDHVRVTATVDERDVARIRAGQRALLSSDAWPGRVWRGRVLAMTPFGDPTQRAFRVRLATEGPDRLPLGITFEVNIVAHEEAKALLVPSTALMGAMLWVAKDGRARQRAVRLGIRGPERVQVVDGLRIGELIIDHPPPDLRGGSRIQGAP